MAELVLHFRQSLLSYGSESTIVSSHHFLGSVEIGDHGYLAEHASDFAAINQDMAVGNEVKVISQVSFLTDHLTLCYREDFEVLNEKVLQGLFNSFEDLHSFKQALMREKEDLLLEAARKLLNVIILVAT